jgi:Patatin-like phospholipase
VFTRSGIQRWLAGDRQVPVAGPAPQDGDGQHEQPTGRVQQDDAGLREKVPAAPRRQAASAVGRRTLRYVLYGARPAPLPSRLGLVEEPEPGKLGICCSGGGIRSAAFNLGALQWLQEQKELEKAAYLAAVSGGSYIAAAFSMVARTWRAEEERPAAGKARHEDSNPKALSTLAPFARDSPEEQYLRNRSSYMAPDNAAIGFLVLRALLGLAFNLVFVSLPLFAAGLLLGEYLYRPHLPHLLGKCAFSDGGCKAPVGWWWALPAGALALGAMLALLGMLRRTREATGEMLEVWSIRLLYLAALLAVLLLATPALVELFRPRSAAVAGSTGAPAGAGVVGGGAGLAALVLGVIAQLREGLATPKKAYEELQKGQKWLRSLSSRTRRVVAYLAGGLIGPLLLLAVYIFGVSVALASSSHGIRPWVIVVAAGAIAAFALLYLVADLTSWSLHPFYKRRLCSAFALKRLFPSDLTSPEQERFEAIRRDRSAATGPGSPTSGHVQQVGTGSEHDVTQDEQRDEPIALERNYDALVQLSDTVVDGRPWPTLLVCAAANISDLAATPPGRRVTSFTFSPYTVGGPLVGAISTTELEAAFEAPDGEQEGWRKLARSGIARLRRAVGLQAEPRRRVSDFSLPAAVAMSGAAISPSMGKLTRRPYTFLLALANVRLGVWVPNPRWVADTRADGKSIRFCGRPRPAYLFREMLGRNWIGARYLYVTDGGHYENLGLVELLRRGCREIYCFDASGGEGCEALGDAIALARSELGVEIGKIDPTQLFPAKETDQAAQMAVHVDFRYPGDPSGQETCRLVYARNVMSPDSPWDALAHHKADSRFPQDSTTDQLYTDQKFEGYRVLGERAAQAAVKLMREAPPQASAR